MTEQVQSNGGQHKRRTRKLINTKLQLKLTLWVMAVATLTMLFQFFLLTTAVSRMGTELPNDSQIFLGGLLEPLVRSFLASLAISLSLTFVVGVLLTHRVAGPIYRLTKYLESVKAGERPADCRLRRNDELHDFCQLVNETTAPLRQRSDVAGDGGEEHEKDGEGDRQAA